MMPDFLAKNYKSATQQARVVTEAWASRELYCPNCLAPALDPTPVNCQATDFICPACASPFQLKSSKAKIGIKVPDGAYQSMLSAIRENRTPNLLLLSYKQMTWQVTDLLIIPHFAFSEQAILPRKPLAATARRAGWIGCNIDLGQITPEARIAIIQNGQVISFALVSKRFAKLQPLRQLKSGERGWILVVLNAIHQSGSAEFTTRDAYGFESQLQNIFPGNRHVRQKIRQQLQVLRDMGLLTHLSRGRWITMPDTAGLAWPSPSPRDVTRTNDGPMKR